MSPGHVDAHVAADTGFVLAFKISRAGIDMSRLSFLIGLEVIFNSVIVCHDITSEKI